MKIFDVQPEKPRDNAQPVYYDVTFLSKDDIYLFNEGRHYRLYQKLGAHHMTVDGVEGTYFAVWAPNAREVSVIGDFNGWNNRSHFLSPRDQAGIWEGFIPGVVQGTKYKYHIESRFHGYKVDKADPVAFLNETPPRTASIVWDLDFDWSDQNWMIQRHKANSLNSPISIYEVHLGSWRRVPEENNRPLTYREMAPLLAEYVSRMGFTHVEFMPIMEHPFAVPGAIR